MIEGILVENRDVIVPEGADQGPGTLLKQARLAAGISIEEAATFLHLARDVILALESNNFQGLPALTFARGYLRAYAKFLNVDAQQVINEFNKLGLVDIDRIPTQKVIVKEFRPSSNPLRWLSYLIAAGLVSLVILWWHNHSTMQDELASNAGMMSLQSSNTITSDSSSPGTTDANTPASITAASTAVDATTEPTPTAPAQDANNNLSVPSNAPVAASTPLPQAAAETNAAVQNSTTTQPLASSPQDPSAANMPSNENASATSTTATSAQPSAAKTTPSPARKKISTWSNPDLQ